jgi:hypothetical protein
MAAALQRQQLSIGWLQGTQRRRGIALTVGVVAVCLVFTRLVFSAEMGAVFGFAIWAALIAVAVRPRYGVYVLLASILFFESGGPDPFMAPGEYLNFSLQSSLGITGGILIPFEMLLLLMCMVWLAQGAIRKKLAFEPGSLGRPIGLLALALLLSVVKGMIGGGTFNYVLWESRFLFGMVLMYVLTANTIRKRAHVRTLLTIVFVFASLSALDGLWREVALIDTGIIDSVPEFWFSHETVVIWGAAVMVVLAQLVFGASRWQRLLGLVTVPVAAYAMLASERRAGLVALMVAVLIFALSLLKINRKAFFIYTVPLLLIGAVYLPLFWNNSGTFGQAARAVRSLSSPDPRDAASNAWRDLEAINVRATIHSDPILGIGFGRPFLQVVKVPDISFFVFWNYEAHHAILWVWMKTGAIGFILFFTVMLTAIARSIWLAKTLRYPELRTFAMLGASVIVLALVFTYVDLGLTSTRVPLLLGVILGTVGVLDRVKD